MKILATTLFVFVLGAAWSQTQRVKGTVRDETSEAALFGATVMVSGTDPILGTVTDSTGRFEINNVPIGRQTLVVQYVGYAPVAVPNVLVTSGKEVILNIVMAESVEKLQEVVIREEGGMVTNELAKVSSRTFDTEQVLRYSGGRNDVARLAASFAGVSTPDDSRNDIVVRGNSPTGLLWQLEGVPIANTNHFATLGTTGGPVNALNTNLLERSDFITGAFPAEYGNANAAVFDVRLRNGNPDTWEFTGQVSAFTGMEAMAEGPINRERNGSFVGSYRYGIASLAATGTSSTPYYQDFSFKANLGEFSWGKLELFGLGGKSNIDFLGDDIDENDLFANPNQDAYVMNDLGVAGLTHTLRLNRTTLVRSTLAASTNYNSYEQDNILRDMEGLETGKYEATNVENRENRYTFRTQLTKKFNARWNLTAGLLHQTYQVDYLTQDRDNRPEVPDDDKDGVPDYFLTLVDVNDTYHLGQSFVQAEFNISDRWSLTGGVHSQYLSYNDSYTAEPRAAVTYKPGTNQSLTFAYGRHSQVVPAPIFFREERQENGESIRTNDQLDFMKSHHFVLGYDRFIGSNWHLKAETYYQSIYDVPVEQTSSSYSVINEGADFAFDDRGSLVNEGTGYNYGVELTLERFFNDQYYILFTSSLYNSRYEGSDGVERNTAFNNRYVANILFGKEWKFGAENQHAWTIDSRISTTGGSPYTPIDLEATRANAGREVLMEDIAFSERYKPYFRWDVKLGVRLNSKNKNISHQFFIDLQNVTNRQNEFVQRYNEVTDAINSVDQIGFFPDIMYRIQF